MYISEYIIETLYKNGIDTYFLLTGGAIAPFVDALSKNSKIKYYCFQHEQSAAMAVEGYYRTSGKIGVVCVTSGPGVQNILNGVCGCWYDSIPAFFITGQVNTNDSLNTLSCTPRQNGFQEMPVIELFSKITKKSLYADNKENIPTIIKELLFNLFTPRYGPVLIDLPVNIQMEKIESDHFYIHKNIEHTNTNEFNIDDYINNSKRPLIIIGHGVKLSHSIKESLKFVEDKKIPFVVTWGAIDICNTNHPLRIGSPGVYGDRVSNFAIQNSDLLIIIGARLDSRQIGNKKLFSKYSKKIMIDIDENEINKFDNLIDYKIISDIKFFFNNLKYEKNTNFEDWLNTIKKWKNKFRNETDSSVYKYLNNFFKEIPDNSIIVTDTGGSLAWTMQTANINNTHKLFSNFGNSSMGFALPAAIGSAIADETRKVYCISGDGGIQLNIQDLLTVNKYNLNIEIIILNNKGYGMIKQFQDGYFKSNYSATNFEEIFNYHIDFEGIANSYGVKTLKNIIIPEDQKIYPKLEFGNSLENMSPYLNREDLENELIVDFPHKISRSGWV